MLRLRSNMPIQMQLPQILLATTTHISPYAIIILTLLGSAFLFFTYYLIMVRCSTRFRRPPTTRISGQEEDFSDQDHGFEVDHPIWHINTIGLQSSVINSISVFKYKKGDNLIDGTDCSVCLNEFQNDETLRLLPKCNHAFHIPCIDMWLRSHINCPLCRAGILSNTLSAVLSSDDHRILPTSGSDPNTQMEDLDSYDGLGENPVTQIEIYEENEDSKIEYESDRAATGSISIDSVAVTDIIFGEVEGVSGGSTANTMTSREEI
ncbi:hypothetical protein L1987_64104 [Smallanthus sonchifolius]|uniref:Uncharacterized protein n=1 Tax=Smallanthus sonchifolius TaxID=185202 RepID=A0ACB9CF51_9ASTR|nr:hypothetical protein L1987_64104 [Smallanthus sonchifolius]